MPTTNNRRLPRRAPLLVIAAVALIALLTDASAVAASEAQQGKRLLQRLDGGSISCASLTTGDFDHIGEYVMERMLGSAAAHEAMNRQMVVMMGSSGETRAHVYMGQRFSGCASSAAPRAFGAMMGMMGAGMMGAADGGSSSGGMMGVGSMMGSGSGTPASGDVGGWTTADTVIVVLIGLLVAIAIVALITWHTRRTPGDTPTEILNSRYARGEIDGEEFELRRRALGGTP